MKKNGSKVLQILLIVISILSLSNMMVYAFNLQVNRIDMNSISVQWDTVPNATSYKAVYSSLSAYSSTPTANIKDINSWDFKTNSNEAYYTLSPLDYGSIYNIFIVPVISNVISYANSTNMVTITTRSDYWAYNMFARDDLAIKELAGISITAVNASVGSTLMSVTPTGIDWYIAEVNTNSISGGLVGLYINGILKDTLAHNAIGTAALIYSIPLKVHDGENFSAVLITGTADIHYFRIKYYDFNKYGK